MRTIKDGLRKIKGGDLDEKIARLLLNYRTPTKTGKSPSEMLLGYRIRSRLDTPVNVAGRENDDWTPDSSVYVRNYGQREKWILGRVKSRMVTVETSGAIVRSIKRLDLLSMFPVADTTTRGATQTPGPSPAIKETLPSEPRSILHLLLRQHITTPLTSPNASPASVDKAAQASAAIAF